MEFQLRHRSLHQPGEYGFTLVEIVVALVILGLLSAIAVTRYMDMVYLAESRALDGALGAGRSETSLQYSRLSISYGTPPTLEVVTQAVSNSPPGTTEYAYSFSKESSTTIKITAWRIDNPTHTKDVLWYAP
jgi:prepilin-type N-terminal cleavage/methylation domain-containing protein